MDPLMVDSRAIALDDEGWLVEPEQWSGDVARALAREQGIPALTDEHWAQIDFVRRYFLEVGHMPRIRWICNETDTTLHRIYQLFPAGPHKGACKVAGLPAPIHGQGHP